MREKKVLICIRRLDKGGAEMLECRLSIELQKQGIETHIAGQYNENLFDGEKSVEYWRQKGIEKICFLNSTGKTGALKAILKLLQLQRREKYSFIITTNSGLDIIVGICSLFNNFKHIIAFHTYINPEILAHTRIKLWKYFVRKASAYYSITDFVKKNTITLLRLNPVKNQTIYNSIDLQKPFNSEDLRKELRLPPASKIILLAGRIESRKGFDLAIEYLWEILQDKDIYCVIVGEEYKGGALESGLLDFNIQLKEKIKALRLKDKVLFPGYKDNLLSVMNQANLFVHLARHEGFGLVLLEAIAAGTPVLASNVGGIPEVLKNTPYRPFALEDKTGILNAAKKYLTMTEAERLQLTNEAKKILSYFTDERRAKEIKEFLESI